MGNLMTAPLKIDSDYLILDVKKGRNRLSRRIQGKHQPIEVLIRATIDCPHGGGDGASIKFCCTVHSVEEVPK